MPGSNYMESDSNVGGALVDVVLISRDEQDECDGSPRVSDFSRTYCCRSVVRPSTKQFETRSVSNHQPRATRVSFTITPKGNLLYQTWVLVSRSSSSSLEPSPKPPPLVTGGLPWQCSVIRLETNVNNGNNSGLVLPFGVSCS